MELDATDWPLVRITQHGSWTADQLRSVFRLLDDLLARRVPFAVAQDSRNGGPPDDVAREIEHAWLDARAADMTRWCRGWAVCRSDPDMPAFTGPAGSRELPTEVAAFTDWAQAQSWALSRLEPAEV